MFPEDYGLPIDESFGDYGGFGAGFDGGFGGDFGGFGGGFNNFGYRIRKATNRDVQEAIAFQLGVDIFSLDLVKMDDLPSSLNDWKHSCYNSGVTLMNVNTITLEDGTLVYYGICPFFPQCNKVHYYVEKPY